ncbi:MAG: glycosyltransferase family 39 protein [Pseudomonadota bacterium]
MNDTARSNALTAYRESLLRWLPWLIVALALAQGLLQILYFGPPSKDEEELLRWATELKLGASDHPTFPSNIGWLLSQVGIEPVEYLRMSRQVLIAGAILLVRAALFRWTQDEVTAWVGALSLALVDNIRGKTLVAYFHMPFVIFAMALLLYVVARLSAKKSMGGYVALGLTIALIFNSKYNGILMPAVVSLMAAFDATARRIVVDARYVAALAIAFVFCAPAVIWNYVNRQVVENTFGKYRFGADSWTSLSQLLDAYRTDLDIGLILLTVVAVFWLIRGRPPVAPFASSPGWRFLLNYAITFFVIALAIVLVAQAGRVNERWIIPGTMFLAVLIGVACAALLRPGERLLLLSAFVVYWTANQVWVFVRYV